MKLHHLIFLPILTCILVTASVGQVLDRPAPIPSTPTVAPQPMAGDPGDRVRLAAPGMSPGAVTVRVGSDYRLDAGDTLAIYVTGKSNLNYKANPSATGTGDSNPDQVTVALSGEIAIPLAGTIKAAGLTIAELQKRISETLARYLRSAQVDVTLSEPRTMRIWVNGAVENPGPQYVTPTTTVAEALLKAGIQQNGSTRSISLKRGTVTHTIDLFRLVATGDLEQNMLLEAGDSIVVPSVTQWAEVRGEAVRPGRYELVCMDGKKDDIRASDLLQLAMGMTPSAAASKSSLTHPVAEGDASTVHFDAGVVAGTRDGQANPRIENGDKINIPSISAYQPMVRMVGEFKGNGVYQRVVGPGEAEIRNKSGICSLAKGQTAGDIIRETGGVTPQADLKRARVERIADNKTQMIPLDLDRVLMRRDSSADVVLQSGDTLVLPGLTDTISVLGEVNRPGSYSFIPNRRLVDYLADAGGPSRRAKEGSITIVRGDPIKPSVIRADVRKAADAEGANNPMLEAGDIVYVPQRIISDWRDYSQIISTIRLLTLF